ncbi:MAG: hypothetical protein ACK5MQ_04465 [Pikeienuella sp.]
MEDEISAAPAIELHRPEGLRRAVLAAFAALAILCFATGAEVWREAPETALIMGVAMICAAVIGWALFTTKAKRLIFDGECLMDDAGELICALEEIERVDRGFAFFKPSAGFVMLLKAPRRRGWSPGLWWRFGRRVGVGGATPNRAARRMADAISGALAARNAG